MSPPQFYITHKRQLLWLKTEKQKCFKQKIININFCLQRQYLTTHKFLYLFQKSIPPIWLPSWTQDSVLTYFSYVIISLSSVRVVNLSPVFIQTQSLALRALRKRKPQETQALALASSQSWLSLLRPSILIGWRLRLLRSACVSCGFRLRNARNAVSYTHLTLPTIYSV